MSLSFFAGTRPEVIKLESLLKEAQSRNLDFEWIHTGQHYDWEMFMQYVQGLNLKDPDIFLCTHSSNVGRIYVETEKYLKRNTPKAVVVLGDTNSTLGVSLAACKLSVPLVHVEAGCRSFDWSMPEEKNRVIISDCADLNLAPTEYCVRNLRSENVRGEIMLSGHPIVKTVHSIAGKIDEGIYNDLVNFGDHILQPRAYCLATFHRVENVDNAARLHDIVKTLLSIDRKLIFPVHPRTHKRLQEFSLMEELAASNNIVLTPPLPYSEILRLVKNASFVLTDSGGLQQEAYLLETPCITVRRSIPWRELAQAGVTVHLNPTREGFAEFFKEVDSACHTMKAKFRNVGQILGGDDVPENIMDELCQTYDL